ncbi:MAG: hypothetical protein IJC14_03770 [Firmicutes bacterium]|nr:hypothetical protein [Bacillota bacterium]
MKDKFTKVLLVIICILLVVCLFQIADLRNEVRNKYNHISNNISNVSHEIMNISSNVYNALEEEASLITEESYSLENPDFENFTIKLNASVTPKEYSESRTQATLYVGDDAYPMKREGSTFKTIAEIPLFMQNTVTKVVFREGDTVRTEALNWWVDPREEAIVRTYANFGGGWAAENDAEKKTQTVEFAGSLDIDIYNKTGSYITKAEVVYLIDGETVKTEIAELQNDNPREDENFWDSIPIEDSIEVPYGSTLDICSVITDNYGLRHVNIAERIRVNDEGSMHDPEGDWIWRAGEDIIYDAEGNCIWNPYDYNNVEFDFEIEL